MSDVHGAAPAGGENQAAEAPDDGLDAAERTQFADMQRETSAPPSTDAPPADAPADGAPAPADGAKPAAGAPAAGADDDEDDEPAAPAGGAAPAPGAGDRTPRRVSFSKYKRETEALQAKVTSLEATDRERAQAQARLDERLKIINEALATPAAEAGPKAPPLPAAEDDPEPNMEEDIFAWNQWNRRETLRLQQEVREGRQTQQAEKQTEQAERETNTTYLQDAEAYAGHEPNFVPAYQFLMGSRVAELAVHYFGKDLSVEGQKLTQQEYNKISQTIVAEEKTIVQGALKAGRSPAAQLYAIAKSRGFRPPAPAADAKPNGAAKPAAAAAGAVPGALGTEQPASVVDEIRRVQSGQDAALSLSGGGGAPPAALDAVKLANMSQEEFERVVESMAPDQLDKLMGKK